MKVMSKNTADCCIFGHVGKITKKSQLVIQQLQTLFIWLRRILFPSSIIEQEKNMQIWSQFAVSNKWEIVKNWKMPLGPFYQTYS